MKDWVQWAQDGTPMVGSKQQATSARAAGARASARLMIVARYFILTTAAKMVMGKP